jgi:hypothetical protein
LYRESFVEQPGSEQVLIPSVTGDGGGKCPGRVPFTKSLLEP